MTQEIRGLLLKLNEIVQGAAGIDPLVKEIADAKVKGALELAPMESPINPFDEVQPAAATS